MTSRNRVQDHYMLSRDFGANTRINLQHYLWYESLEYRLHPSIPLDKDDIRVADIGSGTCIWLIDLSKQLKPSAILDGFDVSHEQCPPIELLPPNIKLRLHDCLREPTDDMVEVYDVVHIQNFNSIVKDNDPIPLIRNVLKMLKPGGHISWGEYDFQTWRVTSLGDGNGYDDDIGKLMRHHATLGGTQEPNFHTNNWTAKLPETYVGCGLINTVIDRRPFSKDMTTFLLDTFMVASWEISINVMDALGDGRGDISRKYIQAVGEHRRSLEVSLDRLTVIGQKSFN